jgi:NAD(P)-dependent dehydrogenase (short-subunit alcohol dehydrogenase family)
MRDPSDSKASPAGSTGADSGFDRRTLLGGTAALALLGNLTARIAAAADNQGLAPRAADPAGRPTVLITGANRGIGLEFARRYGERGYRVIATCRSPATADDLNAVAKANPAVTVDALDVLDHAGVDALSARLADQPIDILLNNAGIGGGMENQLFGKLNYETFYEVMAVNAVGPIKVCEAFLKQVQASGQKKMITVSSSQGSIGSVDQPRLYWYRASKAAVNMLMANLALQVKGRGIVVGLVTPGATDTDFMKGLPKKMLRPVADAVTDMLREIDGLDLARTGSFLDTRGAILPW